MADVVQYVASDVVGKQHQSTRETQDVIFLGLANLQPCWDLIDLSEVIQTPNFS
jgi:hypothetical protein